MCINDACDYIILKTTEGTDSLNNIKLQKLLYYVQAWYLAFTGKEIYDNEESFQAWVHGPVSRTIYDRFESKKTLYSIIENDDIRSEFNLEVLDKSELEHIDIILETYAQFSGTELESMTHSETPWLNARKGYRPSERCEVIIKNDDMETYYKSRLSN